MTDEYYQHTFLFREGLWEARGTYYDASGQRYATEGRTLITHQPDVWVSDGTLKVMAERPMEFQNRYEVVPFQPGNDVTTWKSFNPELETLTGRFVVVEDAIISPWQSESGMFWGTEFLGQVSETEYRGRGFACKGDQKLSSWAVQLILTSGRGTVG